MPLPTVSMPTAWNIPATNGVPSLSGPSIVSGVEATVSTTLASTLYDYAIAAQDKLWGVFDSDGKAVITSGRVHSIDVGQAMQISDATMEAGSFMSYNKVKIPCQVGITMLCDGTTTKAVSSISDVLDKLNPLNVFANLTGDAQKSVRTSFLKALEKAYSSLDIYHVATPEATYLNMNVVGYHLRRSVERGLYLIWADIFLREARTLYSSARTSTKDPSGASQVVNGNVQTSGTAPITPVQVENLM